MASGRQGAYRSGMAQWVRGGAEWCGVVRSGVEWVRSGCGVGAEWARRRRPPLDLRLTAARPPDTAALPASSTRSSHSHDIKG